MNKKLYESLYYKLNSESTIAQSQFEDLILHGRVATNENLEEAQCALMHLVQIRAAIHELTTIYQPKYGAPSSEDAAAATEKERWNKMLSKLQNIENYSNPTWAPPRTEPLSHEELLQRSSSYRDSQQVSHDVVTNTDDEE
jgi:hypothetical protein